MKNDHQLNILGSGWISAAGFGLFGSKPQFTNDTNFIYPELQEYIQDLPSRFGRFDVYTRVCFSTAVLALKDAGLLQREGKKNIGVIVGSYLGVYDNDVSYYESTLEAKGEFSSPNLFSYTLPNVAIGEIAVFFGFTGPTFCVGNDPADPGKDLLPAAISLLESKQCTHILAGWVEVAQTVKSTPPIPKGAAFTILSLNNSGTTKAEFALDPKIRFSKFFGA